MADASSAGPKAAWLIGRAATPSGRSRRARLSPETGSHRWSWGMGHPTTLFRRAPLCRRMPRASMQSPAGPAGCVDEIAKRRICEQSEGQCGVHATAGRTCPVSRFFCARGAPMAAWCQITIAGEAAGRHSPGGVASRRAELAQADEASGGDPWATPRRPMNLPATLPSDARRDRLSIAGPGHCACSCRSDHGEGQADEQESMRDRRLQEAATERVAACTEAVSQAGRRHSTPPPSRPPAGGPGAS